ncbi:FtsX-like permease family protein [Luteimonas sp. TWI662]|uniref:ABC transporter permease n=1 Tax=Luteimonas sp. TWI662 TaxID=3136789 RepID=UPI0032078EE8
MIRSATLPPLRPILSVLHRQRLMPLLVIAQIALACAILTNALFLLQRQLAPMLIPDGIARGQLLLVDQLIQAQGRWSTAEVQSLQRALQAIPGVRAVAPTLGIPMRQTMTFTITLDSPSGVSVTATGFAGEGLVPTLGLDVVRGRDFEDGEYASNGPLFGDDAHRGIVPVILTEALARTLFPDGEVIGSVLSDAGSPRYVVVGTVRRLLRYQLSELDDGRAEYSMLIPNRVFEDLPILAFAVRTEPDAREAVRAEIQAVLARKDGPQLMAGIAPIVVDYESQRLDAFKTRRAAVWLLGTVCLVVTLITLIGIASLTGYWIEQRIRQIGIRRALGATRGDVLRHFLAENALIVAAGLVPGLLAAYAINQWLMQHYAMARLPLAYLPIGAALLWLLGQLAVLGPARRAAAVPPAVATRSA